MSSANSDSFTSFPIWIPFIPFSSLIAMAWNAKTMLNNSSESGLSSFVTDLRRNAFNFFFFFLPLRMMLAMDLSYMAFIMLRWVLSMPAF